MTDTDQKPLFAPSEFWRILIVAVLLICGFVTRLYNLTDPPLEYSSTRQLRSAMIARGIYYETVDDGPEWKNVVAERQSLLHPRIEPEIIENLTALTYRIVNGEYVWIARIYSSLFWTLGGLALYYLIKGMVSKDGAIIALIYYLYAPFGLVVSRIFQPDPLMTAMIILAWMSFYCWYESPGWKWAILSGLSAGAAMYIKSTSIFFLLPAMAIIILSRQNILKTIKDLQVWLIGSLSAIPILAYHIYFVYITGELATQFKGRFFPQMWSDPKFYLQWKNTLSNVVGHSILLIIGLIGLFLLMKKRDRLFVGAIWFGYLLYGFGFSYHITTHYYYTLPAIPLIAITLGEVAHRIIIFFRKIKMDSVVIAGSVLILVLGVAGGYYLLEKKDYSYEPYYYGKVGNFMEPESRIIGISQDYGYRLSYFGWRVVNHWTGTESQQYRDLSNSELPPFSERFDFYSSRFDYFVITNLNELERQEELSSELYAHYPIVGEEGGFVIFDLRERVE